MRFDHLPTLVAGQLRQFYRRKRLKQFLRVVAVTALVHLLLVLIATHVDRLLFLSVATRGMMFWTVIGVTGGVAVAGLVWFWWRRPTLRQVVYELESQLPANVEERYVTLESVLASGQPVAPDFRTRLQESVVEHAATITPRQLVRDGVLRRLGWVTGVVGVAVALLFVPRDYQFPLMVARFYQPTKALPKPSFIKITVSPREFVVGKGGEVVVQAQITGRVPWLLRKLGVSVDRCMFNGEPMSRVQSDRFLYSRGELADSFSFVIRCGDAETLPQNVRVVAQPRILDATLTVTPPAYVKQPAVALTELDRPVWLLPGTKAQLTFRCDQPVVTRTIPFVWDENTRTGSYEFTVKEKIAFEVVVANREGFTNRDRLRLAINLREDARPVVTLEEPTGEVEKAPGELLPIRATATDDFGVAELVLRYVVNPDPNAETTPTEIPLPVEFDLEQTGTVPGDVVVLQVRARDGAGNDGFSAETLVRVVPFTRDENERLRLRQLRLIAAALATNAPVAVEWLEREHHFTDAARYKADLRQLYGVFLTNPPPAVLVRQLIGYREAKNLTWRLYGMRAEAERFRAALQKSAGNERRAKLFLDSLQDIGGELIELARQTKVMAVEQTVGELNTAAYQMRRGSVPRRVASCDEVQRLITILLAQLRQALPALAEQETTARRQLAMLPRKTDGDQRLVGREPFLPEWRRLAFEWEAESVGTVAEEEKALSRELLARDEASLPAPGPLPVADEVEERAVREPSATNDFVLVRLREARARNETNALAGILAAVQAGKMSPEKYPVLQEWARTRRALEALAGGDVETFLAEYPEAKLSCLSANAGLVSAADQALQQGAVVQALELVRQLAALVARCGGDERLTGIERDLRALQPTGTDAGATSRRVVALGEVRRQLKSLSDEIASATSRARVTALDLRGGPAGIWEPEFRADADRSRLRLQQQIEWAQQRVLAGIVERLREKPDPRVVAKGRAWALWWHRVVRLELCSPGGVRVGASAGGKTGDPHRQFLQEELEKARQVRGLKNYATPTKEYLDAVGDFLRY
ncbi:MAG: hypothetical protein PCFJNLEI_00458 [Verrucomicrobiae bacterium]|nr:hypothetical protein [Verrucomicrobiae bacterium]